MALDVQRNWDVAMAENVQQITMRGRARQESKPAEDKIKAVEDALEDMPPRRAQDGAGVASDPVYLPDEIILEILDYIARSRHVQTQCTLAACCLISRQWYSSAAPLLYHSPRLQGHNFDPFVREICPSKNLSVRDAPLANLVRVLDMSSLIHQATKSTTARLLGRTKSKLEAFIAPQRGFAMNAFPALSKCSHLQSLDLSLVSESPPLPDLFKSISHLQHLTRFRLPRSAGFGVHHKPGAFSWPPDLSDLALAGGIDAHFLHGVVAFPPALRALTIEHCPTAKGHALIHLLRNAVAPLPHLRSLKIAHMPRLSAHALDDLLFLLPQLEQLSVSVDYITQALFDPPHFMTRHKQPHVAVPFAANSPLFNLNMDDGADAETEPLPSIPSALRTLEITYSGSPQDIVDKISPIDIITAVEENVLPKLRQVRVAKSLMWATDETEALSDVLIEGARKDWNDAEWISEAMGAEQRKKWEWWKRAGVWRFDG